MVFNGFSILQAAVRGHKFILPVFLFLLITFLLKEVSNFFLLLLNNFESDSNLYVLDIYLGMIINKCYTTQFLF
jgi:hypothetical protein